MPHLEERPSIHREDRHPGVLTVHGTRCLRMLRRLSTERFSLSQGRSQKTNNSRREVLSMDLPVATPFAPRKRPLQTLQRNLALE